MISPGVDVLARASSVTRAPQTVTPPRTSPGVGDNRLRVEYSGSLREREARMTGLAAYPPSKSHGSEAMSECAGGGRGGGVGGEQVSEIKEHSRCQLCEPSRSSFPNPHPLPPALPFGGLGSKGGKL